MAAPEPALKPADLLAREAVERPRASMAAVSSAVIGIAASVGIQFAYNGYPNVTLLEDLRAGAGRSLGRPGLRSEQLHFVADRAVPFLVAAVGQAIAALLFAFVLYMLYRAVEGRGVKIPRVARALAIAGGATAAIGTVELQVAIQRNASLGVSHHAWLTLAASGSLANFAFLLLLFSSMALAVATVLISLASMRAGLLTKFLGFLGVIVGVLMVLTNPALSGGGGIGFLFQAIWAALLGVSIRGRNLEILTPAWREGIAVPWPTRQDIREAIDRGDEKPTRGKAPAVTPAVTSAPSPAASKKKRKKRR